MCGPSPPASRLAKVLLKRRRKNGSLDFDTGEAKFTFDAEGLPAQIIKKTRLDAHRLVEECMLLANQTVARHVGAVRREEEVKPFLYRVHDLPDPVKLRELATFVHQFGLSLDAKNGVSSHELQKLLDQAEGTEVENIINDVALRSMAKAVYSPKNIGHYGLAFTHYAHFTSPIRRYPTSSSIACSANMLQASTSGGSRRSGPACRKSRASRPRGNGWPLERSESP